jgi:hypothetical protein
MEPSVTKTYDQNVADGSIPSYEDWIDSIPTLDEITEYKTDLYAKAFGRDPGEESEYWDRQILAGKHGPNQDWKKWLDDSIYGSQEFKTQGPGLTPHDKDWMKQNAVSSGGGGRYKGPSLNDFQTMLNEMFSNPWTPVGFGWGGTNSDAVRINRSQGSRRGSSYAGNNSSFNRSGSRLNSDTLWMNTLGE